MKKSKVKYIEPDIRTELINFYNELRNALGERFANYKRRPQDKTIRKVVSPILDKYVDILKGEIKVMKIEMKMEDKLPKATWIKGDTSTNY